MGVSYDYFNYEMKFGGAAPSSAGIGNDKFSGTLHGDQMGGSVIASFFSPKLFLELGYRVGSMDGTINDVYSGGSLPLQTKIDRQDINLQLSIREGTGFLGVKKLGYIYGLEYNYINQDVSLTLPSTWIWTDTGNAKRSFTESFHIVYIDLGTQYDFSLIGEDGGSFKMDLIPKVLGAAGLDYAPDQSTSQNDDTGFSWKGQATLDLEARFGKDFAWRAFVEGGWKYVGVETTSSRDYFGPYARVGLTYSF